MFEALKDIACFVTAFVSFIYGSRIAWGCGSECQFSEKPEDRLKSLRRSIPAAAFIYFIGFVILSSYFASGYFTRFVFSVTSAVILSHLVISMAMPELRREPPVEGHVLAELTDGSSNRIAKKAFNVLLSNGKVIKFKRSDGWVLVGRDRLREMNNNARYDGVERRIAA
jgi:hypothetical protein